MPKTICDICMEEYEDNDKSEKCPRILQCGHTFCTRCLKRIKSKNNNVIICPTCRSNDYRQINNITINRNVYDYIWENKQKNQTNQFITVNENDITDHLFKIALIGDQATGKTSLSKKYLGHFYDKEVPYIATIGFEFFYKNIKRKDKNIKLQIWDTAGQERYQSLTASYLRGIHGCIIVFDVNEKNTFKEVEKWIKIYSDFNIFKNKNIILVGNKIDKKKREVSIEEAKNFANLNKLCYFETSALTGENVNECFECITDQILFSNIIQEEKKWKNEFETVNIDNPNETKCLEECLKWFENIFKRIKSYFI